MLTYGRRKKLIQCFEDWFNSKHQKAAKTVNGLSRVELFYIMSSDHIVLAHGLEGQQRLAAKFRQFIESVLTGEYYRNQ